MAGRSEARIFVSIWNDPAFLAQTPSRQRMYFFLLSQADLSYCGVIPLRERRWARSAVGLTAAEVHDAVQGLAEPFPEGLAKALPDGSANPLIVVDEDTEEVFIRSLVRHDGIWKIPNLLKAAREAAGLVESWTIRAALLEELRRIPVQESDSQHVRAVWSEFIADLEHWLGTGSDNPPPKGSANPNGDPSANPSQGRGERNGSYQRVPQAPESPETPSPENSSSPAPPASDRESPDSGDAEDDSGTLPGMPRGPVAAKRPEPGSDADPDFVKFWDDWPKKVGKPAARKAWAKAVKKVAVFVIVAGAQRYAELVRLEGRSKRFIKDPATWLNGEHWTDEIDLDEARVSAHAPTGTGDYQPYRNPDDQSGYDEGI